MAKCLCFWPFFITSTCEIWLAFNPVNLCSNYNALLTQFLLFPQAELLLTLAIVHCLSYFSYFSGSSDGFILHIVSMGNHIILPSSASDHSCTLDILSPFSCACPSRDLALIVTSYITSHLAAAQFRVWGHSRPHLLVHHNSLSFCLLLLCKCFHKLIKFVLVQSITLCQKHIKIGTALLWFQVSESLSS